VLRHTTKTLSSRGPAGVLTARPPARAIAHYKSCAWWGGALPARGICLWVFAVIPRFLASSGSHPSRPKSSFGGTGNPACAQKALTCCRFHRHPCLCGPAFLAPPNPLIVILSAASRHSFHPGIAPLRFPLGMRSRRISLRFRVAPHNENAVIPRASRGPHPAPPSASHRALKKLRMVGRSLTGPRDRLVGVRCHSEPAAAQHSRAVRTRPTLRRARNPSSLLPVLGKLLVSL
jgi:hypothetical protein